MSKRLLAVFTAIVAGSVLFGVALLSRIHDLEEQLNAAGVYLPAGHELEGVFVNNARVILCDSKHEASFATGIVMKKGEATAPSKTSVVKDVTIMQPLRDRWFQHQDRSKFICEIFNKESSERTGFENGKAYSRQETPEIKTRHKEKLLRDGDG